MANRKADQKLLTWKPFKKWAATKMMRASITKLKRPSVISFNGKAKKLRMAPKVAFSNESTKAVITALVKSFTSTFFKKAAAANKATELNNNFVRTLPKLD